MFSQELQFKNRMSRVVNHDQIRLAKLDLLPDTDSITIQNSCKKILPFATIVSLAIFY